MNALTIPVADYVCRLVERASDSESLKEVILRLLSQKGRVLHPGGPHRWTAFVAEACGALGGDPARAVEAAALAEIVGACADVTDDLVDDELERSAIGWPRTVNAGFAMAWLTHSCLSDLSASLGGERADLMRRILGEGTVAAWAGEDIDLALEEIRAVSAEAALDMTSRKSGLLVAMTLQIGAAVATDDRLILEKVGQLGRHIGTIAQLINDVAGVEKAGSDITRHKKTLPVAFALRCARDEGISDLLRWYNGQGEGLTEQSVAQAIIDLGGLHYAAVVAEVHRREALGAIRELVRITGRKDAAHLRRLVPDVWLSREGKDNGGRL